MDTLAPLTKKQNVSHGSSSAESNSSIATTTSNVTDSNWSEPAPSFSHHVESDTPRSDEFQNKRVRVRKDGKKHVQKGSLTEQGLIEAKLKASKGKSREEMSEREKREERRAANRLSAFQSRQRRKIVIEDLQKTVSQLSKDNSLQRSQIVQLRQQFQTVTSENTRLKKYIESLKNGTASSAAASLQEDKNGALGGNLKPNVASEATEQAVSNTVPAASVPNEVSGLLQELASIQALQENLSGKKRNAEAMTAPVLPAAPTPNQTTASTAQTVHFQTNQIPGPFLQNFQHIMQQQNAPQQSVPLQNVQQQNAPQQSVPLQNVQQQNAPLQNVQQQNAPLQNVQQQTVPQQIASTNVTAPQISLPPQVATADHRAMALLQSLINSMNSGQQQQ